MNLLVVFVAWTAVLGIGLVDGTQVLGATEIQMGAATIKPNYRNRISSSRLHLPSPLQLHSATKPIQSINHAAKLQSVSASKSDTMTSDETRSSSNIVVLPGDGIGPEIIREAVRVLEAVGVGIGHQFNFQHHLIGACSIDTNGSPLPDPTIAALADADAILLGAVGHPKYSNPNSAVRPEQGLLELRQILGVFVNLRPIKVHPDLVDLSKVKMNAPVDILFVRELTGGIYFGRKRKTETTATDECTYHDHEIRRVIRQAATLARSRRGHLTSIDKANVLESSRLWRRIADEVISTEFPDVTLQHMYVDAAAAYLISNPSSFDVIVTENMFGDILTDLASVLGGSLGLLPSASVGGHGRRGLYEPIHGSAPDLAGKNIASPYATILSAAMMLRTSLGLDQAADAVERAVDQAIHDGIRTRDIAMDGAKVYTTSEVGDAVIERLRF